MDEILFERRGTVALATLNRPVALNALTAEMVRAYASGLASWAEDPTVQVAVLQGAGKRAFCAGGDIRRVCRAREEGQVEAIADFFRDEYAMDLAVARFPKPHVALWDGVVMGGGVGISIYGSHRVATERTVFAMPETDIGFFCDVGATWFLPRLPGHVGKYLGLTGTRLGPGDVVAFGLATHFVPSVRLPEVVEALAGLDLAEGSKARVDAVLSEHGQDPGPGELLVHRSALERCFSADSVEAIIASLGRERTAWADETLEALSRKSPTSLKVVHRSLQYGAELELEGALEMECLMSQRFVSSHDFCEGVRALLVDRDDTPRWSPATLDGVTDEAVERYFSASPARPLAPE